MVWRKREVVEVGDGWLASWLTAAVLFGPDGEPRRNKGNTWSSAFGYNYYAPLWDLDAGLARDRYSDQFAPILPSFCTLSHGCCRWPP